MAGDRSIPAEATPRPVSQAATCPGPHPRSATDLDLRPYPGDEAAETSWLRALGATGIDPGQGDVPQTWLADPEGPRARRPDPALKQSVDLPCTTIMDVA